MYVYIINTKSCKKVILKIAAYLKYDFMFMQFKYEKHKLITLLKICLHQPRISIKNL